MLVKSTATVLSNKEIDALMTERGFPELEACWTKFKLSGREVAQLSAETVELERRQHMKPLFGTPATCAAIALSTGTAFAVTMKESVRELSSPMPSALKPAVSASYALNVALVAVATIVSLQRYIVYPFRRIMSDNVALMLRERSFKNSVVESDRFKSFRAKATDLGIGIDWDNSVYKRQYKSSHGKIESTKIEESTNSPLEVLRTLLGTKDNEQRKFVPGRFTAHLKEGKRSINKFIEQHRDQLGLIKAGQASEEQVLSVMSGLRAMCHEGSEGERFVTKAIDGYVNGRKVPDGIVEASVWKRDPWVDLTHQKEFFSSASLRGNSLFESGSKGRIGNFGYLYNPAISCLDFSTKKGRVVRARLLAASARSARGAEIPVLFVDGVEGTNSIRPEIIATALRDYAKECGFKALVYNAWVHNRTPRLFVDKLLKMGMKTKQFEISLLDCDSAEYLDSFGLPIQPFEYATPKGLVLGVVDSLSQSSDLIQSNDSHCGDIKRFAQRYGLYLLLADGVLSAAFAAASISNWAVLGAVATGAIGVFLNNWYQKRSQRAIKQ